MREYLDDPFRVIDSLLTYMKTQTDIIFVYFHAETTAETAGIGLFLDGKVSAVVGTHTHVQTSDARVLPGGTACITDVGMCGARNGVLGVDKNIIINKFLNSLPAEFEQDK